MGTRSEHSHTVTETGVFDEVDVLLTGIPLAPFQNKMIRKKPTDRDHSQ
jgi:hypothetical protein